MLKDHAKTNNNKSDVYSNEEYKEAALLPAQYSSNLSRSQMYSHILLMTLQSKSDCIDVEACRHLIDEKGANAFLVDCEGNTFLHWAAWRKLSDIVAYLMDEKKLQPFQKNELNQTPLHWACMGGDINSVKKFIDAGLSVLQPDVDGYTCMHAAAQFNQPGILEFCKFYTNINLDFEDSKGRTALHWAVYKEHLIVIEWLLENGANPGVCDIYGETSMHIASKKNKCKAISTLIDHSHGHFCFEIENKDGKTPFDLAKETEETAKALKLMKTVINRQNNCWWQIFDTWTNNRYSLPSMRRFGAFITAYFVAMQAIVFLIDIFFYVRAIPSSASVELSHLLLWILAGMGYASWFIAHKSNPGTIEKPTAKQVANMFNDIDNNTNRNRSTNNNGCTAASGVVVVLDDDDDEEEENDYIFHLLNGNSTKICITCRVVKPLRSKHCSVCNRCVRKFDHHCPWINNCIGEGNYKQFVWYLLIETSGMILFTILTAMYCASNNWSILGLVLSLPVNIMVLGLILFNLMQIYSHILLISRGWTTNEQYNVLRYLYFRDRNGNVRNPFGHGCIKNWFQFFCGFFGVSFEMMNIEEAPILAKVKDHTQKQKCCTHHNHKPGEICDKAEEEEKEEPEPDTDTNTNTDTDTITIQTTPAKAKSQTKGSAIQDERKTGEE